MITYSVTFEPLEPTNLAALAGRWSGTLTLPSGTVARGTMVLSPTGDYVTRAVGFSAQGTAQIKDGSVLLVTTRRTALASLGRHADGRLVLRGRGHDDRGAFSFEVSRP